MKDTDRQRIIGAVRDAGVVGAGGAGFPTHVKMTAKDMDVVIANGAECEPLLRVDQQVTAREAEAVVEGLETLRLVTGAREGFFGLKKKYKAAIAAVEEVVARKGYPLSVHGLDNFYPAGDEHVLVHEVTGRIVPEGGIPLETRTVVSNVVSLYNIHKAVTESLPVVDRPLTVGGAVRNPTSMIVPVGTPVSQVVALAGGTPLSDPVIVMGGPMMGWVNDDWDLPVDKRTSGVLVLPRDHYVVTRKQTSLDSIIRQSKAACTQCRECTDMCPRYLLGHDLQPHRSMRAVGYTMPIMVTTSFLCCECSLCELYSCPMGLSPGRVNHELKVQLWEAKEKNPHHDRPAAAHPAREVRKVPQGRLVARLDLAQYDVPAPLLDEPVAVARVKIPLAQHVGAPTVTGVKVGQKVTRGDVVGTVPEGALGAPVHASITGRIRSVTATHVEIEGVG